MTYPLGYEIEEINRLKKQFSLLYPSELSQVVKSEDLVLDVGCGAGDLLAFLPKGITYTGIDIKDVVRSSYRELPNINIIESDFLSWNAKQKFTFINLRLVLWSVSDPTIFLKKALGLCVEPLRFFSYEPDDRGLEFSHDLQCLSVLAKNWQTEVLRQGKDPFIGEKLQSLLSSANVTDFDFKESILLRQGGDDIQTLKDAANNLIGIFSKYPNSEVLAENCREHVKNVNDKSWFKETEFFWIVDQWT